MKTEINQDNIIAEIVARASNLREHGAYDQAVQIVREGLREYPNDCCLLRMLAILLDAQGNADDAILTFRKVIQLMPSSAEAHYNLAITLSRQGLSEESAAEFRISISLDPNAPDYHEGLGRELAARNLFVEALSEQEAAIQLRPDDVGPYMDRALILYDLAERDQTRDSHRKWEQAKEAFLAAIKVAPTDSEAYYGLGLCEFHLKHFATSIMALENAIRLAPEKEYFYPALCKAQTHSLRWLSAWNTAWTYSRIKNKVGVTQLN